MTIEQEARDIVFEMDLHGEGEIKSAIKGIAKALQAKQDRIEVLEKKLELEKEELTRWQDSACRLEGNLNTALSTIEELENELRAYDLDIYGADGAKEISNMRKRIETLESALREVLDYVPAKGLYALVKKALGGGA